jgi:uncharacterized protein YbaP (TraB family)
LSIVLTLALTVILTSAAFAASPAPPPGAEITDIYSPWAENDVFMAQDVYNLGIEGTYSNFRGNLAVVKFAPIIESLKAALKSDYAFEPDGELLTRGQVVAVLYGILSGETATEDEAVEYFIDAGLIFGRSADDYQLDEICTVEEMIALSARVYNHGIYDAGKYSIGFFWEVEGAANKVYLLGSIHISDDSMYPMSKPIETAFARSANLVVEADISGVGEEDQAFIMERGFYDPLSGETIADYLSEETFAMYAGVCESIGLPEEYYVSIKPWMAHNFLTLFLMVDSDIEVMEESAAAGIDMYFITRAAASGKNILQLESIEFQIDLLSSYSDELQEMMLRELLLSVIPSEEEEEEADDNQPADMAQLYQMALAAIKAGDEETLIALFGIDAEIEEPLLVEYNNKMFLERDIEMAKKIDGFLQDDESRGDYFIVVGAGHLVSKKSVVAQLIEMGYAVERIK